MHRQARTHPVLIIDEAHLLANEILADLRLLTNFEVDSSKALTVLCGQESLARKFDLSILEALANSITVVVQTRGLGKDDTMSYVEERIKSCGGQSGLFTKQALITFDIRSGVSTRPHFIPGLFQTLMPMREYKNLPRKTLLKLCGNWIEKSEGTYSLFQKLLRGGA